MKKVAVKIGNKFQQQVVQEYLEEKSFYTKSGNILTLCDEQFDCIGLHENPCKICSKSDHGKTYEIISFEAFSYITGKQVLRTKILSFGSTDIEIDAHTIKFKPAVQAISTGTLEEIYRSYLPIKEYNNL